MKLDDKLWEKKDTDSGPIFSRVIGDRYVKIMLQQPAPPMAKRHITQVFRGRAVVQQRHQAFVVLGRIHSSQVTAQDLGFMTEFDPTKDPYEEAAVVLEKAIAYAVENRKTIELFKS